MHIGLKKYSVLVSILLTITVILFVFQSRIISQELVKSNSLNQSDQLSEREFYYWFSISDYGNLTWIDKELRQTSDLDTLNFSEFELDAYIKDLKEQRDIAFDTIGGVFPLVRFMFKNIFFSPEELNPFEIIDDPSVIAVSNAVNNQIETIVQNWKAVPHFDVIFISNPANLSLENEALYLFNQNSKFFVHNYREKRVFLEKFNLTDQDLIGRPLSDKVLDALGQHFDASNVIITLVSEQKSPINSSFFVADGHVIDIQSGKYTTIRNMGFAIDAAPQLKNTLLIAGFVFVIGFFHLIVSRLARGSTQELFINLGFYSLSFILVLMMPSLVGPILHGFVYFPAMETLAISGWWIAPVSVILTFIAPALIFYGVVERLKPNTILRNIEANNIVLLAIMQAIFVWFIFLYLIFKNDDANVLIVVTNAAIPLLLFQYWKDRLIGLELNQVALFVVELAIILVLLLTASVNIILYGLGLLLFVHVVVFISKSFASSHTQVKNLSPEKVINQDVLSPASEQIIKKIDDNPDANIHIILSNDIDFGNYVFDVMIQNALNDEVILEIDARECLTEYALVSLIVGRRVEHTSQGFDAAIGFAGDLIPFGSMISEKATTSGVKNSHIKECGYMHLKTYLENSHCRHILIRSIKSVDTASIEWLSQIKDKPWARHLKIYLLSDDDSLMSQFSDGHYIKHELDQMDRIEAVSYLHNFGLLSDTMIEMIVDELSNNSGRYLVRDLKSLGEITNQIITQNPSLNDFAVFEKVKTTFINSQDEEVNQIIGKICENPDHKLFMAITSYLGAEVDLPLLAKIMNIDIKAAFKCVDEINATYQVFLDPRSDGLSIIFRSSSFHNICCQFFQFHKEKSQQTSFAQYVKSEVLKTNLEKSNLSDDQISKSLFYLFDADGIDPIWLLSRLLDHSKQMSFSNNIALAKSFFQMSRNLFDKIRGDIAEQDLNSFEQQIEITSLLIQLQNKEAHAIQTGERIERFFLRWSGWIDCDPDIIYLMLRKLYDLRFERINFVTTLKATCDELLKDENNHMPWFRAELIHYTQLALLFINHDSQDKELKNGFFKSLREALNIIEIETDSPSELASYSRIATTIISQDPYGDDIDDLADKATEIKRRLFDEEGVAITKGAVARASFFVGIEYMNSDKKDDAIKAFHKFLIAAEEWKDISLKTNAPSFVILMNENMRAQTHLNLSQLMGDQAQLDNAYDAVKSVFAMGITPDVENMSELRQLGSTYSLLLELQLSDEKFRDDYSLQDTKVFYDQFQSNLDAYIKNKFSDLIRGHKLNWKMAP